MKQLSSPGRVTESPLITSAPAPPPEFEAQALVGAAEGTREPLPLIALVPGP